MRGHIITCIEKNDYKLFVSEGFAGLYPKEVSPDKVNRKRALMGKITTNWDIIADLKRVKPGDYVFLHTEKTIYGPFIATTHFLEAPDMPDCLKSRNLRLEYWKENYTPDLDFPTVYPYRIGIESVDGITRTGGFSSMELFKRRSVGEIISIPQRFWYHDGPKIVKPLLNHEIEVILSVLDGVLEHEELRVESVNLESFVPISLDLSSYRGELYREKILEAWLMENATLNGNNGEEHQNVVDVFGAFEHFVNTIFTYYTNFMDVLFYDEATEPENEHCPVCGRYSSKNKENIRVVELKKGFVPDSVLQQISEYGDWAVKMLAGGDRRKVKLYSVGTGFSQELLSQREVKCVRYTLQPQEPYLILEQLN